MVRSAICEGHSGRSEGVAWNLGQQMRYQLVEILRVRAPFLLEGL
ncbi:MAG: hypothetical protein ACC645_14320 [Pirellulales bacterium]